MNSGTVAVSVGSIVSGVAVFSSVAMGVSVGGWVVEAVIVAATFSVGGELTDPVWQAKEAISKLIRIRSGVCFFICTYFYIIGEHSFLLDAALIAHFL